MKSEQSSMRLLPIICVSLLSLAGCTTVMPPQVIAPCPAIPQPPAVLLSAPPASDFQTNLRDYFFVKPAEPMKLPPTRTPATSGSRN